MAAQRAKRLVRSALYCVAMKRASPRTKFGKLMLYAPIVLEMIRLIRRSQHFQWSKYTKIRKSERVFDFLLGQVERKLGKRI